DDFRWLRRRLARTAACFDGCRLDHVVGYFRMYVRPGDAEPDFEPATSAAQEAHGARLLDVVHTAAGAMQLTAEDLGAVPEYVRAARDARAIPGYRVLRWQDDEGVLRDPRTYAPCSVATSGTHDTSALATWWTDELDDAGRRAVAAAPVFAPLKTATRAFT